jgi:hypothetical protein
VRTGPLTEGVDAAAESMDETIWMHAAAVVEGVEAEGFPIDVRASLQREHEEWTPGAERRIAHFEVQRRVTMTYGGAEAVAAPAFSGVGVRLRVNAQVRGFGEAGIEG